MQAFVSMIFVLMTQKTVLSIMDLGCLQLTPASHYLVHSQQSQDIYNHTLVNSLLSLCVMRTTEAALTIGEVA